MAHRQRQPSTPSNGNATETGLDVVPADARVLSPKELSDAFGHVPWMEFNVTARPNLKAFSTHPAVRQVISQVAQGTLDDIKDAITANVMRSINEIVEKAIQDATGDVPKHVMNNMAKTFGGLSLAPTVTPNTQFQPLQSQNAGIINNYNTDNSVNNIGNTNNVNSGNNNINSGNTDTGNNNGNPVVFPPTPGPFPPGPIPEPDPNPALSVAKPDIGTGQWIWTQEQPYGQPPGGPRAFRKYVSLPAGTAVDSMVIDITCDNYYTLYVNGSVVGNGTDWTKVQRYSIKFPRANRVLIAVYAANDPILLQQAGLIASAVMWDSTNYAGRTYNLVTDNSWKCSVDASASGFEKLTYKPDSTWGAARVEGPYGMAPWGAVAKPTSTNAVTRGFSGINMVADPPSAPLAMPGPDADGTTTL